MTTTDEYIAVQYDQLCRQAQEMISADPWFVAVMSNLSALIFDVLPDLNWAGFYLLRDGHLVVGPFQGKPACICAISVISTVAFRTITISPAKEEK